MHARPAPAVRAGGCSATDGRSILRIGGVIVVDRLLPATISRDLIYLLLVGLTTWRFGRGGAWYFSRVHVVDVPPAAAARPLFPGHTRPEPLDA